MKFLHPSWHFYALIFGVITGIAFFTVSGQPLFRSLSWFVLVLVLVLIALFIPCRITLPIAFAAGFLLAGFRFSPELADRLTLASFVGQTVTISGTIAEDPDFSESGTALRLSRLSIDNRTFSGLIYVKLSGQNYDFLRSDHLVLRGKFGEGFGTFVGSLYRPEIVSFTRDHPGDIFARFKQFFSGLVHDKIDSPVSDLGLGYLMGQKNGLTKDFSEQLRAVGMTHVVVASGAHLAIIVVAVRKIFGRISKFAELLFAILAIAAFVLVVGFTPSMTRAALVAVLGLLLGFFGRKLSPFRLLGLVAALTLLISPTNLQNIGWQLSFASFFGIMIIAPRLTRHFYGGKNPPWLTSMLITSLSTTLICAPVMIFNFGSLSLLSFVANLIILPTLPYAMVLVFLTGATSFLPLLSSFFAILASALLNIHVFVIDFLSQQETFILTFASNNPLIYLIYLPILAVLLYDIYHEHQKRNRNGPICRELCKEPVPTGDNRLDR